MIHSERVSPDRSYAVFKFYVGVFHEEVVLMVCKDTGNLVGYEMHCWQLTCGPQVGHWQCRPGQHIAAEHPPAVTAARPPSGPLCSAGPLAGSSELLGSHLEHLLAQPASVLHPSPLLPEHRCFHVITDHGHSLLRFEKTRGVEAVAGFIMALPPLRSLPNAYGLSYC